MFATISRYVMESVEKGFLESDLIVENKYVIPKMNACLPEPSTSVSLV